MPEVNYDTRKSGKGKTGVDQSGSEDHNSLPRMRCDSHRDIESASVRSNVRAFQQEKFTVWRCNDCASIHLDDEVDLSKYYAQYP